MGRFGHFGGMSWIGMILGGLALLFVLAVAVTLVILAVRASRRAGQPAVQTSATGSGNYLHAAAVSAGTPGGDKPAGITQDAASNQEALKILHERYARGEIDDETYQRMRKNLS